MKQKNSSDATLKLRTPKSELKRKTAAWILMVALACGFFLSSFYVISGSVENRSGISKLSEDVLGFFVWGGNADVSRETTLRNVEKRRKANADFKVPGFWKFLYNFETYSTNGFEVCKYPKKNEKKAIVYFHGGSFMGQPLATHFDYCNFLRNNLGVNVIMPVYPKAPEYNYRDALSWLSSFYAEIENEYDIIAFMGDSAGGALMFSFSRYLYDNGKDVPPDLVAFSPCLDLSLNNPDIENYARNDAMLNHADLKLKLSFYVGDGSYDDPYVNPICCDFSIFEEITVFIGTRELLLPDARLLNGKLNEQGVKHTYLEFDNQFHVFSITPIPERWECLKAIKKAIGN